MKRLLAVFAVVLCAGSAISAGGEADEKARRRFGPPAEVIAAWQAGEGETLPGPPDWVLERRGSGPPPWVRRGTGAGEGGFGPPAWVIERQQRAAELGLPGPPPEVIEAWQNGDGFSLPGPPDFVLELLGM